jgi:hypothetical protein
MSLKVESKSHHEQRDFSPHGADANHLKALPKEKSLPTNLCIASSRYRFLEIVAEENLHFN